MHECDDGNKNNGDGCSDECMIEQGFQCMGGSDSFPDFCTPYNFEIGEIIQKRFGSSILKLNCQIIPPPFKLFSQD